jgi:hypothetical protein
MPLVAFVLVRLASFYFYTKSRLGVLLYMGNSCIILSNKIRANYNIKR